MSQEAGSGRPSLRAALLRNTWAGNAVGLLVLAAIVGGLFALNGALRDNSTGALDDKHPEVGEPAPNFALKDADGNLHRLDDYRGKVVWVNFWATTCGPCREELPSIQKVADQVPDRDLAVLEVNQRESEGRALDYLDSIGVDLPVLFDREGDVSQQYRLQGLPYNFFIDKDGVLRSFKPGFLSEEEMWRRLGELGVSRRG